MKKIFLLTLTFILAACSFGTRKELNDNIQKWQNTRITHYRFSLFIGCFCPFTQDMPVSIEVRDGNIVSITKSDGTLIQANDPEFETIAQYGTIDRFFSELKTDLRGGADKVSVKYDSTYGYPSQISIDFIEQAVDDELSLTVSDFQKLD